MSWTHEGNTIECISTKHGRHLSFELQRGESVECKECFRECKFTLTADYAFGHEFNSAARFCDRCKHLSPTEDQQNQLESKGVYVSQISGQGDTRGQTGHKRPSSSYT